MMKKTIVAVALMVSGAAFAGDEPTCGKVCTAGRAVKHYGYEAPKAAGAAAVKWVLTGEHSGSTAAKVSNGVVRVGGIYFLGTKAVELYAYVVAQVKRARK